jgi:hypothetical protein
VPFDLLYWNGDTTNLPAKWHLSYLTDLYRDNLLVKPGAMAVAGVPLDLSRVTTPAYIQAGREDHIAPPESVWKITDAFAAPCASCSPGRGISRAWSTRRRRANINIGPTTSPPRRSPSSSRGPARPRGAGGRIGPDGCANATRQRSMRPARAYPARAPARAGRRTGTLRPTALKSIAALHKGC